MCRQKIMVPPDISSHSVVFTLLVLIQPITGNQLSITSGFFQKSVKGKRLSDCLISEKIVSSLVECGQWCLSQGCHSLNYGKNEKSGGLYACELNNRTRDDRLMLVDKKFEYYEMIPQCNSDSQSEPSFSVLFPQRSLSNYVEIDDPGLPELSAITICAWVKFFKNSSGTILSYAVPGSANEIGIWCYTDEVIFSVKNSWKRTKNSLLSDGLWHAMCVTWSNVDGNLTVYKDNVVTEREFGMPTGQNIIGGGRWVLGQDQDSVGGGFEIEDSFRGELVEVNVWGRVLTRQEIARFSTDCQRRMNGDVKHWSEFRTGLRGNVQVVDEQSCT